MPPKEAAGVGAAPVIDPVTRQPATSWVLRDKSTGAVVMETSQKSVADNINTAKYEAVPIGQHLASLSSPQTAQGAPANVPQPAQSGTQASQTPSTQGAAQGSRVILQNRDRSTPSSIAQMRSIAARPDYGRLGFSRDFANGAPVVAGGMIQPAQLGRKDVATVPKAPGSPWRPPPEPQLTGNWRSVGRGGAPRWTSPRPLSSLVAASP